MKPSLPPTTNAAPPRGSEMPDKCELGGLGGRGTVQQAEGLANA